MLVMHSKNIIHRDLKPDNIFIVNDIAKIGDLGLALVLKTNDKLEKKNACARVSTEYFSSVAGT